jgi:chromosome segregation ATPase
VNDLTNQLNQANAKISQYSNEITILNQKIEVYINKINIYTRDNEDLRSQMIMIRGDLDKKSAELQTIINIKVSLDNRIGQLENEIRKITEVYQKVTFELNQKLIIISDWEKRAKETEERNKNSQSQIEIYASKIQNLENFMHKVTEETRIKIIQLEKLIADLREKEREQTIIKSQRDNEIQSLKTSNTTCKEEWNRLSESYESVIVDIKNQLSINEHLKNKLSELMRRIEVHNQNVISMDSAVKQQIEILTRHNLTKKVIDLEQDFNKDVSQSNSNIESLRMKLSKIESQKLYKTGIFNNNNISCIEHNSKNSVVYHDSSNVNNGFNKSSSTFIAGNTNSNKEGALRYYSNSGFRHSQVKNENNQALFNNLVNKSIVQNVYKVSDYQSVERKNIISNSHMNTMAKSVLKNYVNKSDFFSDNDD